jgi:pimeloyl-ACP methyl ester carboxylesterase
VTLKQSIVRVNQVDLNVVDIGDGDPALVFLHYWGGSSRTWVPVMQRLSGTHRCVAIDFRGWGDSTKDATDHSLGALASDVIGVVAKLGLEDFVLLGHSMGGKVAQIVAARQVAGLRGLILFAPAPPVPLDLPEDVRRSYVGLYQSREGVQVVIGNLTPHALADAVREQITADTLRGSAGAKEAWPMQGMLVNISEQTSRISVPVHVIAGGDDSVEPEPSLRAAFDNVLRNVTYSVIAGVGHIAPLEAPSALSQAIRAALQSAESMRLSR